MAEAMTVTPSNVPVTTTMAFAIPLPGRSLPVCAEFHDGWWVVSTVDEYPPEWGEGRTVQEATDDLIASCRVDLFEIAEYEGRLSGHMQRWLDSLRVLFPDG